MRLTISFAMMIVSGVVDVLGLDQYTYLASGLNCEGLVNALE